MRVLKLTLSKKPFEVMVTGEKDREYRRPSKWILSRLFNKEYDVVEFTNGYGKDKPRFTCEYRGYLISASERSITFSNGLALDVKSGDVVILLGKVISVENYNQHL